MAALQQSVGGQLIPPNPRKTFAEAVLSSTQPLFSQLSSDPTNLPHANPTVDTTGTHGMHKGFPSIVFSDAQTDHLSQTFAWTLVAKFSHGYNRKDPKLGRPSVDDLQKFFQSLDFRGSFQIGLLDNRHLLIQFQCEEDYLRMYSRQVWFISAVSMRIFKWSPFFRVDKESSVVPVWICFPHLPVHLFRKDTLFSISCLLGTPLRLDEATAKLKRPSVARIQVELDVLRDRPAKLWIQMGTKDGFWQSIDYENVLPYCCHCCHIGHQESQCHVHNPALHPVTLPQFVPPPKQTQIYVPKNPQPQHTSGLTVS